MILNLACIVEGHGELQAVPVLLRRLAAEADPMLELRLEPLIRASRSKLVKANELERTVELAARRVQPPRAILILVDADDDCPKELAPKLLERATKIRSDVPIGLVLARREFEAWFLAAFPTLAGVRGLPDNVVAVEQPEEIRDAKGYISGQRRDGRPYSPPVDQPALAQQFDIQLARRNSRSFDKCCREVLRLFTYAS
jgi:hypothetical protein